jgi:hypothetical protein
MGASQHFHFMMCFQCFIYMRKGIFREDCRVAAKTHKDLGQCCCLTFFICSKLGAVMTPACRNCHCWAIGNSPTSVSPELIFRVSLGTTRAAEFLRKPNLPPSTPASRQAFFFAIGQSGSRLAAGLREGSEPKNDKPVGRPDNVAERSGRKTVGNIHDPGFSTSAIQSHM